MDVYYGQDGAKVSKKIYEKFQNSWDLGDIRFNKNKNCNLFDFVGLVVTKNSRLVVFPKHTFDENEINNNLISTDILKKTEKVLFETIVKFSKTSNANPRRVISEARKRTITEYPFMEFLAIYDYYEKYGLYSKIRNNVKKGQKGNYSWKEIISKSNFFFSGRDLIFDPMYTNVKNKEFSYVTKAMSYVINETLNNFYFVIEGKRAPKIYESEKEFMDNNYVIRKLSIELKNMRKDIDKVLLKNLIDFFEFRKKELNGKSIRIDYFNLIWQEMVHNYLSQHKITTVTEGNNFNFVFTKVAEVRNKFSSTKKCSVDISEHKFQINFDHYYFDEEKKIQWIFDSKYFDDEKHLNYKQIAYQEFMSKKFRESNIVTYSGLIFPSNSNEQKIHFKLNPDLFITNEQGIEKYNGDELITHSIFLDVIGLMEKYINI